MTGFVVQGHILEWFQKDNVSLRTGVKFRFAITGVNYILKYIK